MMRNETPMMRASHATPPPSWNNGRHRVQVRLLQVHPAHPDSRQSDRVRRFTLDDAHPNIILGRASRNRSLIPASSNLWLESPIITKEHARFIRGPTLQQPLLLRDLHSTHGTQVAGVKINSDTPIEDGVFVTFGDHITNGPLYFEPPTFMIEYDVTPVSHPPTPDTSNPPSALRSTSLNHFEAPGHVYMSDDESLDELISTRAVPDSMAPSMASQEKEVVELFSDDESAENDTPFTVQVPASDTSDSSESEMEDSIDEDDLAELESDLDQASSRMSLPPTQARYPHPNMAMPRRSVDAVFNIPEANVGSSPTTSCDPLDAPSVKSPSVIFRGARSFQGGFSAENPILLDASEPADRVVPGCNPFAGQRQPSFQERQAQQAESLFRDETAAISLAISSLIPIAEMDSLSPSQRQPSPSDAALVKTRAITEPGVTETLAVTEQDPTSWFGTNIPGQSGSPSSMQINPSQLPGIPAPQPSQPRNVNSWRYRHTDGPFKAPELTRPKSLGQNGRSRSFGLAIEELIHPPANNPSLKRSRDESEFDEEESDSGDFQPYTRPSPTLTGSGLRSFKMPARQTSATERKQRPQHEYAFMNVGADALKATKSDYESDFDEDAFEVDDDDFGYGPDSRMADEHDKVLAANHDADLLEPADLDHELEMQQVVDEDVPADNTLQPLVTSARENETHDDLDALINNEVEPIFAELPECELPMGSFGHVSLDPDQLLATETSVKANPKTVEAEIPALADFSATAAGSEAARLSQSMTRDSQQVPTDESAPPRKKAKITRSSQGIRRPRFRRFMNKAVPFVAGAVATAATIFVGAGVLISTIHDDIKQEALQEMGL